MGEERERTYVWTSRWEPGHQLIHIDHVGALICMDVVGAEHLFFFIDIKLFFICNSWSPLPAICKPSADHLWFTASHLGTEEHTPCMFPLTSPEPAGLSLVPSALWPEASTLLPGSATVRRENAGKDGQIVFQITIWL